MSAKLIAKGYPPAWISGEIQRAVCERAGWRCEHCGMEFPRGDTRAVSARNRDGKPAILTVHHLDGDPSNCDWTNLLACCQACHLHIQATWKPGGVLPAHWEQPPMWVSKRGLAYVANGQLALFEDGEI